MAAVVALSAAADAQPVFAAGALAGSFNCWQSFSCDRTEAAEARHGPGAFFGIRGPLDDRVQAGIEISHRWKDHGNRTAQLTMLAGQLFFRPTPLDGLWLRGGVALGVRRESGYTIDDMVIGAGSSNDPITTLGALHDIRVAEGIWVTPHATLGWVRSGEQRLWDVGLAVSWSDERR